MPKKEEWKNLSVEKLKDRKTYRLGRIEMLKEEVETLSQLIGEKEG